MTLKTLEDVVSPRSRRERRELKRLLTEAGSVQLIVHGKVQEVGFGSFVLKHANRAEIRGWVRDRSDGTVEVALADRTGLPTLADVIHEAGRRFDIDEIEVRWLDDEVEAGRFSKKRKLFLIEDPSEQQHYSRLGIDPSGEAFGPLHRAGLLREYCASSVHQARTFWREKWGVDIDPAIHIAFENYVGRTDARVIPPVQSRRLQQLLNNDRRTERAYTDKNLYGLLVSTDRQPKTFLRRANGRYFDGDSKPLERDDAWVALRAQTCRAIIKPARTANGRKVALLTIEMGEESPSIDGRPRSLDWVERNYGENFLVQEVLAQHPSMAQVHSASVNTLRMLTVRHGSDIHHLLTFARFGVGGRINDNAGTGGICVGVNDDGSFESSGVDENANRLLTHPTSGVRFESLGSIPNYGHFKDFVCELHERDIIHHHLVSWDICVGTDGLPIFLEHNFRGAMWIYQLATCQPVLGDLTEELLHTVR